LISLQSSDRDSRTKCFSSVAIADRQNETTDRRPAAGAAQICTQAFTSGMEMERRKNSMENDAIQKLEKALSENDIKFLVKMAQEEEGNLPPEGQKPPANK
jgi:hypothetical protein